MAAVHPWLAGWESRSARLHLELSLLLVLALSLPPLHRMLQATVLPQLWQRQLSSPLLLLQPRQKQSWCRLMTQQQLLQLQPRLSPRPWQQLPPPAPRDTELYPPPRRLYTGQTRGLTEAAGQLQVQQMLSMVMMTVNCLQQQWQKRQCSLPHVLQHPILPLRVLVLAAAVAELICKREDPARSLAALLQRLQQGRRRSETVELRHPGLPLPLQLLF